MSTTLSQTASNKTDIERAREILSLENPKLLSKALSEAALEELQRNKDFVERVRTLYSQYSTLKSPVQKSPKKKRNEIQLVPLKRIEGREINPAAPLDPFFLFELYGETQLPTALDGYSRQKLLEAVDIVEQKTPGQKLRNKGKVSKDGLVSFILSHVR